jgi:hypothetical protein
VPRGRYARIVEPASQEEAAVVLVAVTLSSVFRFIRLCVACIIKKHIRLTKDEANWISQNVKTQLPKRGWAGVKRAVAKNNKNGRRGVADG